MNKVILLFLFLIVLLAETAPVELATKIKQFDRPRAAPTARIISLSRSLIKKKGSKELLSDKAGSFDNFEAFERLEEDTVNQDNEAKRPRDHKEKNVGVFFPEDEIPE